MAQKSRLLCMFTPKSNLDLTIEYINSTFKYNNYIFIYNNVDKPYEYFCTFTVNEEYDLINRIIIIHRKSESNTLYTINAINEIIKRTNNGQLIFNHPIDWSLYNSQLLLYKNNIVEYINFKLIEKI